MIAKTPTKNARHACSRAIYCRGASELPQKGRTKILTAREVTRVPRPYGRGRTCVSVFGHCGVQPNAKDPLEHAPFRRLVLQGIAWAAGREPK